MASMRFAVVLLVLLGSLPPVVARASCDGIAQAPLVFPDRRACTAAGDERIFLRSTGAPWVAYYAHGYACLTEGKYRIAAFEFATAHALQPRDVRPVISEAVAYDRLNAPARVARLVALARRLAPGADPPMRADTLPGATQLLHGHSMQAFANWTDLAEHPYNRPIYEDARAVEPYRRGLNLAVRGRYCDALTVLAPVVAAHPEFGDIRFVMGAAFYALGERDRARYEWDSAAIETPAQPGFWIAGPIQWTALNLIAQMPYSALTPATTPSIDFFASPNSITVLGLS